MAPPSILVLGAGELGGAILRALATHPSCSETTIAVFLRASSIDSQEPVKKTEIKGWRSLGVQLIEGDIVSDSEEQLALTFRTYHTVIGATGMTFPSGTQVKIVKAAIAARVKRYFPWQFGIDYDLIGRNSSQDLFTEQLDVRELLRGQSMVKWTIVSTGMFISFLFEPALDIVNTSRDTVTAIGDWENSFTVTSPEDIGKLVAEMALAHLDLTGVVFAAGDTVSMRRLGEIVERVRGAEVKRRLKTVSHLKDELAADPDNGMRKYRVVFAEGVGVSWDKASSFNEEQGIPTMTVDEWAGRYFKRT